MATDEKATRKLVDIPTVMVLGGSRDFLVRCSDAAANAGALTVQCGLDKAASVAAERLPLAILVTEELYAFDPSSFYALARDVRAVLVPLRESVSTPDLEAIVARAIQTTQRTRPRP
jgi:hypothetical protein